VATWKCILSKYGSEKQPFDRILLKSIHISILLFLYVKTGLIKKFRDLYVQSFSTLHKQRIISKIILLCTHNGGRFLELRSKNDNEWVLSSEKRVRRKVALAIQYRQRCQFPNTANMVDSNSSKICGNSSREHVLKTIQPSFSLLELSVAATNPPMQTSPSWSSASVRDSYIFAVQELSKYTDESSGLPNELSSPTSEVSSCYYNGAPAASWHNSIETTTPMDQWTPTHNLAAAMEQWPIISPISVRNLWKPRSSFNNNKEEEGQEDVLLRHPVCWSPTPSVWGDEYDVAHRVGDDDDGLLSRTFDM
jgi:hypothetical protein